MQKKKATISDVKQVVNRYQGCRIKLEAKKKKKKLYHKEGTIEGVYPSIFTVMVDNEKKPSQRLSFSYSDVLTRSVKINLVENGVEDATAFAF